MTARGTTKLGASAKVKPSAAKASSRVAAPKIEVQSAFYRGRGRPPPNVARPIVKWAGGKARLVERLVALMPPGEFETYAEPFCGGAAMFFALSAEPRRRFRRAVLSDKNEELILLYRAIQRNVEELVTLVREHEKEHLALTVDGRRDHYYELRERSTATMSGTERGARTLFLNKTCFNGLWRVNASGQFNVPFGRYKSPRIADIEALRAASRAFEGVDFRLADFGEVAAELSPGDFAYFDPPYVPVSKTSNFTAYATGRFDASEQERLAQTLETLRGRGVFAMLSNACSDVTKELYGRNKNLRTTKISVARSINSDPTKRGDVDELVVTNYVPRMEKKARSMNARKAVRS